MIGEHDLEPEDPALTADEFRLASQLRGEELEAIDQALLANASQNWRKVAFVVASAMHHLAGRFTGLPDVFFAHRVRELVANRALEGQGKLRRMRFSEVRLPSAK